MAESIRGVIKATMNYQPVSRGEIKRSSVRRNTYVAQPVSTNGESNGLGSNTWREDLRWNNPVDTANTESKVGNVQPDEHRSRPSSRRVLVPRILVHGVDCSDDELRDGHARTTNHENLLAAPAVHEHDGRDGGEEVDDADHAGG